MAGTVNFYLGSMDVNQNVNLYDAVPDYNDVYPSTHYNISVNADMEFLLGMSGTYVQNSLDPNLVNITLAFAPNVIYLKRLLGYDNVYDSGSIVANHVLPILPGANAINGRKGVTTGVVTNDTNKHNIGFRLLEIAAIQIFNHAKARAAIRNDTEFNIAMQTVVDNTATLVGAYNTASVKDDIYNSYVRQNIEFSDDITSPVAFNFQPFNYDGYQTALKIEFNMPVVADSQGSPVDPSLYGMAADPKVNILLRFVHVNEYAV